MTACNNEKRQRHRCAFRITLRVVVFALYRKRFTVVVYNRSGREVVCSADEKKEKSIIVLIIASKSPSHGGEGVWCDAVVRDFDDDDGSNVQ